MSDSDEYKERQRIENERLAPLLARLPENCPPGMISIGPGWYDLVVDLDAKLAEIDPDYSIIQVKEKFACLRFYATTSDSYPFEGSWSEDPFFQEVTKAEALSLEICEDCGAPGKERGGSWTITLCDACETGRAGNRRIK